MKKRNLIFVVLVSFFTLGLYNLWWFYDTRRELVARGAKIPSFWLPFVGVLGLLVVAALQIVVHFNDSPQSANTALNVLSVLVGIASVLWMLIVGIYWLVKYCRGVAYVTKDKFTFETALASYIVASIISATFAWVGYTQSLYNKIK